MRIQVRAGDGGAGSFVSCNVRLLPKVSDPVTQRGGVGSSGTIENNKNKIEYLKETDFF